MIFGSKLCHEKLKPFLPCNILGNPLHPAKVAKILERGLTLISLLLGRFIVSVRPI